MGRDEKFIKARFSQHWVYPGWFASGKQYRKTFSEYPEVETLARLAVMSKRALSYELEWLEETGYTSEYYVPPVKNKTMVLLGKLGVKFEVCGGDHVSN
jgi:hypothetical protein